VDVSEQVARVDGATVSTVARRVLGSPTADVVRWEARVAYGGFGVVAGTNCVLRVSGEAADTGGTRPWSAYVKITRVPPADAGEAHDPTHNGYWRREIATYESGLLRQLPEGLAAPRCYAVVDAGDCAHLWLEDVPEDGAPWSMARFALAARQLGRFNGQYLAGRPLPAYPWLSRTFLRARADHRAPFWGRLDALRAHRLFAVVLPGDTADRARALFAERHAFLDALDRLPQTLVHQDAYHRNLMARAGAAGQPEIVAVDWAWTGVAGVGAEAAPLVLADVVWGNGVGVGDLPALDAHVFAGYLEGLREAGWRGDARLARLGYAASAALRYGPLFALAQLAISADEQQRAAVERTVGQPFEEHVARYGRMLPFVLERAEEARQLLTALA
jgi:hypothetical protein